MKYHLPFKKLISGEVILVVGGYSVGVGGPRSNTVEIFSPDGKCNFFLAATPKLAMGAVIQLYNGRITVCGGDLVLNNIIIEFRYIQTAWICVHYARPFKGSGQMGDQLYYILSMV